MGENRYEIMAQRINTSITKTTVIITMERVLLYCKKHSSEWNTEPHISEQSD